MCWVSWRAGGSCRVGGLVMGSSQIRLWPTPQVGPWLGVVEYDRAWCLGGSLSGMERNKHPMFSFGGTRRVGRTRSLALSGRPVLGTHNWASH